MRFPAVYSGAGLGMAPAGTVDAAPPVEIGDGPGSETALFQMAGENEGPTGPLGLGPTLSSPMSQSCTP